MRLGSALLLGMLLALVLVLISWGHPPQPGGLQGKHPFNS